ncbi:SDR family oxidoreductase [Devosia nitrariae]|uniref:Oxidoreductase n=1 Tax=Devosia nitrariae TaxID=2071872 RepID=A0ABQ5W3Y6_9HYPH|nr:SDR family oxidoreductase [Devosia nitrariae]GLQ54782.1 oxidoreductase [Devosia nitrariae]
MNGRLAGKTALVTGAGAGIGRAVALAFAGEGAKLTAISRSAFDLGEGIATRRLDVADTAGIHALAEELGTVDIIANVAGYVHAGTILDCSREEWEGSFAVNVTAIYETVRAFLPAMLAKGRGNIVCVGSIAGAIKGTPGRFAYGASKAALVGLVKGIAADFVGRGIRANLICPGTTDTPSLDERARATGDYEAARAAFIARQPMGRLGRPEEIAALAVHLASDESAFTTGAVYVADGGATI